MSVESLFLKKIIPEPNSGCWIWTGACERQGYGHMVVGGRTRAAHRLAYELFKGPIPEGLRVLHSCDVRECVNPDHLHVGTQKQNIQEAISRGRFAYGEHHGRAKLTQCEVDEIKVRLADGESGSSLAREYGVHNVTISSIRLRKNWLSKLSSS